MTAPGYAHYIGLFDRSGSMRFIREETENGIRVFFEQQRDLPGKATVSEYQFDHEPELVCSFEDLLNLRPYKLTPRGSTALLDAIGYALEHEGRKLELLPEEMRPEQVFFFIATDGKENSSRNFQLADIRAKLQHQQDVYKWEIVYMGANVDAFAEAGGMGVPSNSTLQYANTTTGEAYKMSGGSVRRSRISGQSVSYTPEEREQAKGES
jgi:uncharacterized protein YegL